jgi:ribosomal protein S18 acetylase RimI-like enzyme
MAIAERGGVLDDVAWQALSGPHRDLADRNGLAARYQRDVAPFSGIADRSAQAWDDLAELVGAGKPAILFGPALEPPGDWTVDVRFGCLQLVATDITDRVPEIPLVDLGPQDVPEMMELVQSTNPGPFSERTIDMGRYLGHKLDGRLVAMAGERMRVPGFVEVSAVCTADDQRGKGLGAATTLAVVRNIRERGDDAFLHVKNDNTTALRLYLALGFTVRREVDVVIARKGAG